MKPSKHIAISAGVSLLFWFAFRHFTGTILCFLSGVFIDVDHHLDYWMCKGKFPWRYQDLVAYCSDINSGRQYLIFHSFELLTLFWLAIFYFDLGLVWAGIALGLSVHLICDQFANPLKPLAYFTTYRWINDYDRKKLFTGDYQGKVF